MEARTRRTCYRSVLMVLLPLLVGAGYRTPNFVVTAETPELAEKVGKLAERYRHTLAIAWTGKPMPDWSAPCPILVKAHPRMGAAGETSFVFDRNEVFGWKMKVLGSEERVLDSVLPHEITHTIFASHFRRPLPRWADEGACTMMEHDSERSKQHKLLQQFLRTGKGIPFAEMFRMKQYPDEILPLYAQGYSTARFLIQQGGRQKFVAFLGEGMDSENWTAAIRKHYEYESLGALQQAWLAWVEKGSPTLAQADESAQEGAPLELVAWNERSTTGGTPVFRGQSPASSADAARVKLSPVAGTQSVAVGFPTPRESQHLAPLTPSQERDWEALPPAQSAPAVANQQLPPTNAPRMDPAVKPATASVHGMMPPSRSIYDRAQDPTESWQKSAAPSAQQPAAQQPVAPSAAPGSLFPREPAMTAGAGATPRVLLEWGTPESSGETLRR